MFRIKTISATAICALSVVFYASNVDGGLILHAGESYIYEFDSIEAVLSGPSPTPSPSASYLLNEDTFESGTATLYFSVFEDGMAGTPLTESLITPILPRGILIGLNYDPWWGDLDGSIKLEVIEGSVELESFTVITHNQLISFKQTHTIPEPSSIAFLVMGSGVFWLRRRRNR